MSKVSLLCVLVLLVSSSLSFIIKDCVDCEPQVSPVILYNRIFISIRIYCRALIHRPYYRLFILTLSNILVRVPQPFWLIILVNHTVSFNLFNTLVRLFPLVLQPFNRLFLSTLSNLSRSTSKKLNFIHISPVKALVLQPL